MHFNFLAYIILAKVIPLPLALSPLKLCFTGKIRETLKTFGRKKP